MSPFNRFTSRFASFIPSVPIHSSILRSNQFDRMGRVASSQLATPTSSPGWSLGAILTLLLGGLYHISDRMATMVTVDMFQEHNKRMDDKFKAAEKTTDLKFTMLEKHMDFKLDELKRLITEKRY